MTYTTSRVLSVGEESAIQEHVDQVNAKRQADYEKAVAERNAKIQRDADLRAKEQTEEQAHIARLTEEHERAVAAREARIAADQARFAEEEASGHVPVPLLDFPPIPDLVLPDPIVYPPLPVYDEIPVPDVFTIQGALDEALEGSIGGFVGKKTERVRNEKKARIAVLAERLLEADDATLESVESSVIAPSPIGIAPVEEPLIP